MTVARQSVSNNNVTFFQKNMEWEQRIRSNKNRRNRQLRRYRFMLSLGIVFFLLTVMMMATTLITRAQSKEQTVDFKYYTNIIVAPDETLNNIAMKYMDTIHYDSVQDYVDEVKYMNHIDEKEDCHAGDYLIVPYYSSEYKK